MRHHEYPALLETRQTVYSFISTSFLEVPKVEYIKIIIAQNLFEEFPLEIDQEEFKQGLNVLRSWSAASRASDIQQVFASLSEDYTALFIGPGRLLAPPWESVYLTEEKLTFGEPTLQVREFYLRHGFEFIRKNLEPDDHFGLEMEFLSKLIAKELQALAAGKQDEVNMMRQEQAGFLREHILTWVDDFMSNIISQAKTPYFQGLAHLTKGFLTWDYVQLQ